MIKFYTPKSPTGPDGLIAYHDWLGYGWLGALVHNYEPCGDIEQVLTQSVRVACVHIPIDLSKLTFDTSKFNLFLVSDIEYHDMDEVMQWLKYHNIDNYLLSMGGVNLPTDLNIIYRPWWAFNVINYNKFQDTSADQKPYHFDCLLGAKRSHRDYIMAKMQDKGLLSTSIVTYRDIFHGVQYKDPRLDITVYDILDGRMLAYPYISENLDPNWEVQPNMDNTVSYLVPWKIYQQTRYSIVAETHYTDVFFLTEKTTKPLLAKRLFVVFSSAGYLKNLRQLGFKTFNSVIDESYDEMTDPLARFAAAFRQVEYLTTQNYKEIMDKIKDITEHNYQRLLTLHKEKTESMKQMVDAKIKSIL